ncbi:MAG: glutamine-hydrolyzing carbamoyl-phosphate synthase small subunit [Armatimonadetes bacterium]|nr:glutamine-hydrolyzing carbamoyl-phosphate synthase small subunit [Armatimonadota bacterium]
MSNRCLLVLEDRIAYEGTAIGSPGTAIGEVVFSTSMTGYQEMLTDPSYAGQLLTLTYPLIGNYGVAGEDFESRHVQAAGFVVRQLCDAPSHWRAGESLPQFLARHHVVGVQGIDTRALTRHLRVRGVMLGILTTELDYDAALRRLKEAPPYDAIDFVCRVSTPEPYTWEATTDRPDGRVLHVALVDCGVKFNIMRCLAAQGCRTTVFPCTATAAEILASAPDGIAFSPGPGDPARLEYVVNTARDLLGKKPIFGICLGNQIVGQAFGATTFKLRFGHRGGNHPVKDLTTGRVTITSQNHGYAVDPEKLAGSGLEVTHVNLNDGTVEGLRHRELPVFTIQYHPEAHPGPHDSRYLFEQFIVAMEQ